MPVKPNRIRYIHSVSVVYSMAGHSVRDFINCTFFSPCFSYRRLELMFTSPLPPSPFRSLLSERTSQSVFCLTHSNTRIRASMRLITQHADIKKNVCIVLKFYFIFVCELASISSDNVFIYLFFYI